MKAASLHEASLSWLLTQNRPLISDTDMVLALLHISVETAANRLLLRMKRSVFTQEHVPYVRKQLIKSRQMAPDGDFGTRIYRLMGMASDVAETACCSVDPFCYVSHLSAMERYGISDRVPDALILTSPATSEWRLRAGEWFLRRSVGFENYLRGFRHQVLRRVKFPPKVRGRAVRLVVSKLADHGKPLKTERARIASIGRTFADMLADPELCGGMAHVVDVWRRHVADYLEETITEIDRHPAKIVKVRAGYILQELLSISHPIIERWKSSVERGGSRKLDPSAPYAPIFSEVWQISINL